VHAYVFHCTFVKWGELRKSDQVTDDNNNMGNSNEKSISPSIVDYAGQNYKDIKEKCMKSETLFEDTKFPKGDIWGGKYDPDIIWKRAKYLAPQTPWFYFEDGASRFHVNQGELGNCWFV